MPTAVGEKVADFTLKDHTGEDVTLSAALQNGPVVLAFFPMAFTGVCTAEMCEFRDKIKDFEGLKATVFGISVNSRFTLAEFAKQQNLNFKLLADFNKDVSASLGILYEDFLGMKGVSKRSVYVVNQDSTVAYKWSTDNAGESPSLDAVKEALAKI